MSLYARITGWIVLLFGLLYFALPLLGLVEFSLKARRGVYSLDAYTPGSSATPSFRRPSPIRS